MTQRDWQKDMEMCEAARETEKGLAAFRELGVGGPMMAAHWLQEAKERGRRERHLKKALEHCIKEYPLYDSKDIGGSLMMDYMKNVLNIFYPDTPAPKEGNS